MKKLAQLGLVETRTIGRAGIHTINESHVSIAPLRALVDPMTALKVSINEVVGSQVEAVLIFGSIARGEATPNSDIDLAVIAAAGWDGRTNLEDIVRARFGNDCDVLVFTPAEFAELAAAGEPVVSDILRDGVALVGSKPRPERSAV